MSKTIGKIENMLQKSYNLGLFVWKPFADHENIFTRKSMNILKYKTPETYTV